MANQLTMAKIQPILTLHQRGWSNRRIARTLGVHRKTVPRYVRTGSDELGGFAVKTCGVPRGKMAEARAFFAGQAVVA